MLNSEVSGLPLVVYCLPIYNGGELLHNCIESILNQTYQNVKILIGDNHSTDSTKRSCEYFAKNYSNIIYIRHSKNHGCYWNYLKLIASLGVFQAKYFVFAQDDTTYMPNHAQKCIDVLEKNEKIQSCMSMLAVDKNPKNPIHFDDLNTVGLSLKDRIIKYATMDQNGLFFSGVHRTLAFENMRDVWFNLSTNRLTDLEIATYILVSGESVILRDLLAQRTYSKTAMFHNESYNTYLERHHVADSLRQGITIPFCNGIRKICQQIFQRSDISDINEAIEVIELLVPTIANRYAYAIDLELNRAIDLVSRGEYHKSWHQTDIENEITPKFKDKMMSIFLGNLTRDAIDCYTFLKNDKLKILIDLCQEKQKK